MYTLQPVIQSSIDFTALGRCRDLTEIDKHSSKPVDKISKLASSMFSFDCSHQFLYVTFYFNLPPFVVEVLQNCCLLKIQSENFGHYSEGFISGTVQEFKIVTQQLCTDKIKKDIRSVGNLLYTFFNMHYKAFKESELKQLSDGTFSIR